MCDDYIVHPAIRARTLFTRHNSAKISPKICFKCHNSGMRQGKSPKRGRLFLGVKVIFWPQNCGNPRIRGRISCLRQLLSTITIFGNKREKKTSLIRCLRSGSPSWSQIRTKETGNNVVKVKTDALELVC